MAPIDPRLVIHNRVNTKASLVTKDAARIYGSQWKTKLIVACSTMESEYNALSTAMQDLIPLRTLFRAVAHGGT